MPWKNSKSDSHPADSAEGGGTSNSDSTSTNTTSSSGSAGGSVAASELHADDGHAGDGHAGDQEHLPKGYTPKKGHATPKRNEVERAKGIRRGPVRPPMTSKEARQRRKEEKASMSKEEYKAKKARERAERREARRVADERMASGDPRYLLPRDQGPERKLVRDWVDTRRFLANFFMPFALVLLLVMLVGQAYPTVAAYFSLFSMVFILVLIGEGVVIGRRANRLVREQFPSTTDTGFRMGFYAYSRASQPRRLRTPRPQKEIGDKL
nr:DUF3043 domain-containing protein [Corynebacterium sp. TAE3-ERU12]